LWIALVQWHFCTARQQRPPSRSVKLRRRRAGLLAGESFEHWFRQMIGIAGDWRLEAARSQDGATFSRQLAHRK